VELAFAWPERCPRERAKSFRSTLSSSSRPNGFSLATAHRSLSGRAPSTSSSR
jgi:hypothetical protein